MDILEYLPAGPSIDRFHQSRKMVRCMIGPLGSAKTTAAIVEVLSQINQMPVGKDKNAQGFKLRKSRWAVVRNSQVDLKASTIKDWKDIVPPELGNMRMQPPITQTISYPHEDGETWVESEVLFMGFDIEQDVKKIRGLQLTGVWCDEGKELPKHVVDMLLGRCGRYPARRSIKEDFWYGMLITSNAPARDEWLAQLAFNTNLESWDFFIQPGGVIKSGGQWVPNPKAENIANLPPQYYDNQVAGKREDWVRANLANEFVHVSSGRPVHPDFSERIHVADYEIQAIPGLPLELGADFGRTPACAIGQRVPVEGGGHRWQIIDEFTTVNTSVETFSKELMRYLNELYPGFAVLPCHGDPSGMSMSQTRDESCIDIMNGNGIDTIPAPTNDFDLRTSALDRLLHTLIAGEPAILLSAKCVILARGLAGAYKFRRIQSPGAERYTDKPDKGPESHVVEALHYMLLGAGEGDTFLDPAWVTSFGKVADEFGGWHPDQSRFM